MDTKLLKHFNAILFCLASLTLCACDSNNGPSDPAAWSQLQPGMTRQQVYAALGKPASETQKPAEWDNRQIAVVAKWHSSSVKSGGPDSQTQWRTLELSFGPDNLVHVTRLYQENAQP